MFGPTFRPDYYMSSAVNIGKTIQGMCINFKLYEKDYYVDFLGYKVIFIKPFYKIIPYVKMKGE